MSFSWFSKDEPRSDNQSVAESRTDPVSTALQAWRRRIPTEIHANLCDACINVSWALSGDEFGFYHGSLPGEKDPFIQHHAIRMLLVSRKSCQLCALLYDLFSTIPIVIYMQKQEETKRREEKSLVALNQDIKLSWQPDPEGSWGMKGEQNFLYKLLVEDIFGQVKQVNRLQIRYSYIPRYHLIRGGRSLRAYTRPDDPMSQRVYGRPVNRYSGSTETLSLARSWVEDCYLNHSQCRQPGLRLNQDPVLPTRLIYIGASDDELPRLIHGNGGRGKWIALSHRWATDPFMKTEMGSIAKMQEGIPRELLPKSFQDALVITRALGLRLIWIDSLCIVQDSDEDWQREAGNMPAIYRNAYATIAAAATEGCTGGIFVERAWAPLSRPCDIPVVLRDKIGNISLDFSLDHYHKKEVINYLLERAWCFQESNLSPRLITFDRLQMSYTCVQHGLQESQQPTSVLAKENRNAFLHDFDGEIALDDLQGLQSAFKTWYVLLADYTSRNLHFYTDKLVALGGMASVVGAFIQDKYYAGLWMKNMPQALLWSPYEEETLPNPPHRARKTPQYRAPSWSWASIESPISYFLCRQTLSKSCVASLIDIHCEYTGPGEYGKLEGGTLAIEGPLKPFTIGPALDIWPYTQRLHVVRDESRIPEDAGHCVFDLEDPEVGSKIWCLQLTEEYGLLLQRLSYHSNYYKRKGIFHLRQRGRTERSIPWFSDSDTETIIIL